MTKAAMWKGAVGVVAIAISLLYWAVRPVPLERDPPRDLPWVLPDYREASTQWRLAADGRIHTEVEHFFLPGITPAMLSWFYQQLPIATVQYRGKTLPLYHIFHPSEHGTLRVLEAAVDGTPGMGLGAMIQRDEWFGPYDSRGAARLVEFSASGMLAVPMVAGLKIGEVRHTFTAEAGGTRYHVSSVIGSELPVLGRVINWYLHTRVFHPQMLAQWRRHQVEEVASLQFFLPHIYAQRGEGPPYRLDTSLE